MVLTGLALALAQPVARWPAPALPAVHVLDASDSISDTALQERVVALEDSASVVVVAGSGVEVWRPGEPLSAAVAAVRGPGGHLGTAVSVASALGESVVLHSDGGEATQPLPKGVALAVEPLEGRPENWHIAAVPLPPQPTTQGATATVEVVLFGGVDGLNDTLAVRGDDRVLASKAVSVAPGAEETVRVAVPVPQETEPGLFALEVAVAGDSAQTALRVGTPPEVWLVGGTPRDRRFLAGLGKAEGMRVVEVGKGGSRSLAELEASAQDGTLEDADLVVLVGPPAQPGPGRGRVLPAAFLASLEPWVRAGGGLVAVGGDQAYDQGGWHETPLAALLPVVLDPEGEEEEASVTLVIALDKSNSMAESASGGGGNPTASLGARLGRGGVSDPKIQLVTRAASAAIGLLADTDQVGVLAVDSKAKWVVPVQPAARRVTLQTAVLSIGAAGGGIFTHTALDAARPALLESDSRLRHLIVFADTNDAIEQKSPATGETAVEVVQELTDNDVTVSVIGIGRNTGRDTAFLRQLAREGGGRFSLTNDARELRALFVKETEAVLAKGLEEDTAFRATRVGQHPALQGVAVPAAPTLLGMNRTLRRPGSRTLLVGPDDRPLLATRRLGRGQVAAWTADASGRWAAAWTRWDGGARLWTQLLRSHARQPDAADGLDLTLEGRALRISARGDDGLGQARPGLSVWAEPEGAARRPLPVSLVAPGQWEAPLDLVPGEAVRLTVRQRDTELGAVEAVGPPSAERQIAHLDGLPAPRAGTAPAPVDSQPLWRWLVVFAALLLPVEAVLRRRAR